MQGYFFEAITPESAGISSEALERFYKEIVTLKMPLHSFLLLRHGKLITEGYWCPHTSDDRHIMYSVSKSITSLAVGFCIEEGLFQLSDRVVDILADRIDYSVDDFTKQMTVRNLLTMCSGHPCATDRTGQDWVRTYLTTPPPCPPGSIFNYDSMATHTLCAIIQKVSGMKMMDYLKPRLFDPLHIDGAYCFDDPMGINTGSRGVHCKTRDMAKLGQLFLQNGCWEGKQIVPAWWIKEATKKQVDTSTNNINLDGNTGYGYQFWHLRGDAYGCRGIGGQWIVVIPSLDLVWVSTGCLLGDEGSDDLILRLFWSMIAPFVKTEPIPENTEAYARLLAISRDLSFPMPDGLAQSDMLHYLPGKTYRLTPNEADCSSISFAKFYGGLNITLNIGNESLSINAGLDKWLPQYFDYAGDEGWARCVFTDAQTIACHIHLKNKLGGYKLVIHISNKLTLQLWSMGYTDFRRLKILAAAKLA